MKGFGDISYLIDNDTRLSFMFGATNNRFQIPNNPNQTPQFGYLDTVDFNSADLDERQRDRPRGSACWRCRASSARTDYQVSAGPALQPVGFTPDEIGDLMFNGVAATINRTNRANTLQADLLHADG